MKKLKIIAVIAAILVGLGLYQFLKLVSQPDQVPTTNIVVATQQIPQNTAITAEMVQLSPVPTTAVVSHAMVNIDEVVGKVLSSDVYAGEQILSDRIVALGETVAGSTLAYAVKPGMRAVTIPVDAVSGLANMLRPGNAVDVVLIGNYEPPAAPGSTVTPTPQAEARLLLQNIEVLAVDAVMDKAGFDPTTAYSTVTVLVTPEQAVQLHYAQSAGSVQLTLRSSLDQEIVKSVVISNDDVIVKP